MKVRPDRWYHVLFGWMLVALIAGECYMGFIIWSNAQ